VSALSLIETSAERTLIWPTWVNRMER